MLFWKKPKKTPGLAGGTGGKVEYLIVGLGNPGARYAKSRHNAGFMALDRLADGLGTDITRLKHKALTGTAQIAGRKVLLMKPQTYMNLSGQSVGEAASFYKISPAQVLVISDDTALDLGVLRLRTGGSSGGQNGLDSVIQHLKTQEFPRLRIGVGTKPHPDMDMADWVLSSFTPADREKLETALEKACRAVKEFVENGVQSAMSRYNG